ncbi:chromatin assembly factor 1 subunit A-like [Saccostrea cucullata]|uniref:chromatin assembly factor 1 subunit A-like n=1 Tax=Saccostrea cuccullata TaxID=36930 RepID=UPI002ED3C542
MAQAETTAVKKNGNLHEGDESPPLKKLKQLDLMQMKQGRLPFKPVDVKPKTGLGNTPPSSKKRKLSDGESPSAKPSKTPKSQEKAVIEINESEVSSSSEADHQSRKNKIRNTLERFVCRTSQEEISSTNDGVDFTESKGSPICIESDESDTEKEKENIPKTTQKSTKQKSPVKSEEKKPVEQDDMEVDSQSADETAEENEKSQNESENSSTSPDCATPAKDKASDSILKTPTSKLSDSLLKTPKSASDLSCSDSTPGTAKRAPRRLSDAKKQERDARRQKIKEEKEKQMEEKRQKKEQEKMEKEREKERLKKEREEAKAEKERQKQEEKVKLIFNYYGIYGFNVLGAETRKFERDKFCMIKKFIQMNSFFFQRQKEQKLKESFTNFFVKPKTSPTAKTSREPVGMFMPFEVKKDMLLAPKIRKGLDSESKEKLDQCLQKQDVKDLYISELRGGKFKPRKHKGTPDNRTKEDEVVLVHDSETVKSITYHCKLLQFHMNYRPPYYGTWRKRSSKLSPRNPFKMDNDLFDYEVDSDDEWEEEEPGESLSASEGEEEENNEDEEDEEADWMVPHGYLSEGEGCEDEEEEATDLKMRCRKKLEQWEMELKRQTTPALPIIMGCFWEHAVHELQKDLQEKLAIYKAVPLVDQPIDTSFTKARSKKAENTPSEKKEESKKGQCKPVPEEAMPDLIRLVHGNLAGIKKLVKEFRLYWKHKTNEKQMEVNEKSEEKMEVEESVKKPDESKTVNLDESDAKEGPETKPNSESEDEFSISKRQLEMKITSIATREKRDSYKKICWYVNDSVLEQYNLKDLPVPSAWEFISQPKKTPIKPKVEEQINAGRKTPTVSITQFARPMSPSALQAQFAAANAAALANKQKQADEQAAKTAEQAVKVTEVPQQKTAAQSKEESKSDQPKLNFFSPSRPQQWKMVSTGSSPKDSKRLVLMSSQPSAGKKAGTTNQDTGKVDTVSSPSSSKTKLVPANQSAIPAGSDEKANNSEATSDVQTTGENSREAIVLD